jgi:hypothetical protein
MECSLGQALQGALAILTRVRPKDLSGPARCASRGVRALVNHVAGTARCLPRLPGVSRAR